MLIISIMTVLPVVRNMGALTVIVRPTIVILPVIIVRRLPAVASTVYTTTDVVAAIIATLIVML